ncbi:MAG: toll/interleukin-1 receptor domain-containing protein [Deltaproteobacteria bacterium]|nr:toll/interleukin-1 receptor domain-containing protein [Deltaproteobacteria bacterium]
MANQEHVKILKQGVEVWNRWREENPDIRPDLTEADMRKGDFKKADFHRVNFTGASFEDSDLSEADFFMVTAIFAIFNNTDLSGSNLNHANLQEAELDGADLSGADLIFTNFNQSSLLDASFNRAIFGWTSLGLLDFSRVTGLDSAIHEGPSILGIDSILKSKGEIPESFLRGCGLPEDLIKLIPSLIYQPFQFYSCFISYSSYDDDFTRRLHADLRANNVSVWFAPEDLKIGDRIRDRIDHSIRIHDKLLLILT